MVRWCWVNFQCRGVLLIWIIVGQGPTVLAVGAGGGCLDIFSLAYHFSFLSPSLWETARYRLKYCLKGPLSPKQPTNQINEAIRMRTHNIPSCYKPEFRGERCRTCPPLHCHPHKKVMVISGRRNKCGNFIESTWIFSFVA